MTPGVTEGKAVCHDDTGPEKADSVFGSIGWIVPFLMAPLVVQRHSPAASLAWLIFIFFQPWAGVFLYFLFGTNIVLRNQVKSYCKRMQEIRSLELLSRSEPHLFRASGDPGVSGVADLAQRLACMQAVRGNAVELIDDGRALIERLIADIEAASHHVHLLFYIFADDEAGRRVAHALERAAARGVTCRVLVDAFGSRSLLGSLSRRLTERKVALHTLMPLNPLRRHLSRLDLRNHRKLAIVDGRLAYTGSQNIEEKDYDPSCADGWHDLMLRITGPAVTQLQMVFAEDWYYATGKVLDGSETFPSSAASGNIPLQIVPSGPADSPTVLRDILLAAIHGARETVVITTPYFVPDEPIEAALRLASMKGVRIDLIIPRHADHPVVGSVARAHANRLIGSGIRIRLHEGVLHAKTMSVDEDLALIGTANFDLRSFFLHSELSVLLYGPEIVSRLRHVQNMYLDQSVPIDATRWKRRSRWKRTRDELLSLLSPLL